MIGCSAVPSDPWWVFLGISQNLQRLPWANCYRDLEFGASDGNSLKMSALSWRKPSKKNSGGSQTHSLAVFEVPESRGVSESTKIQVLIRKMTVDFALLDQYPCVVFFTWFIVLGIPRFNGIFENLTKLEISITICSEWVSLTGAQNPETASERLML